METKINTECREYKLINKSADVDLTKYTSLITNIIHKHAPKTEVIVESDKYTVFPKLSQTQAVTIGKELARTELGNFFHLKPVLFKSTKVIHAKK